MTTHNMSEIAAEVGLVGIPCKCGKRMDGRLALEAFFTKIIEVCRAGGDVRLKNFGTFDAKVLKGGRVNSPILGGGVAEFGDSLVLRFHQSSGAKNRLNGKKGVKDVQQEE